MRPVPRSDAAARIRGRYKVEPEDFVVEEIPSYLPSGQGDHVYLRIEKRLLSTIDLLSELGAQLDRDERAFGIAGLKDARAISQQWVSIEHVDEAQCRELGSEHFKVLEVKRHGNKLRLGHLRGNRFRITLRGTAPGDVELARAGLAECARLGVPNYFGEQRFGKRGANLQKGLDVLMGNPRKFARRMPRRVFGLVVSAVQSEVFNHVVAARRQSLHELMPGDLAFLHDKGAVFAVTDPAADRERLERVAISPSGPMPGPKMTWPEGEPLAIERAALAELDLDPEAFAGLPYGMARGERRPLRVPVTEPDVAAVEAGLQLSFGLPRGAYATSVLRELLVDTIWFAR